MTRSFKRYIKVSARVSWIGRITMVNDANRKFIHICETCGRQDYISSDEAFDKGWDYPPKMGAAGIISPRTCGGCPINTTLWWDLVCEKKSINQLSERHLKTLQRILDEERKNFI